MQGGKIVAAIRIGEEGSDRGCVDFRGLRVRAAEQVEIGFKAECQTLGAAADPPQRTLLQDAVEGAGCIGLQARGQDLRFPQGGRSAVPE